MGTWETFFLIKALKFLIRWLTSNEKNRDAKVQKKSTERNSK